jgi:hypothetical protein
MKSRTSATNWQICGASNVGCMAASISPHNEYVEEIEEEILALEGEISGLTSQLRELVQTARLQTLVT